MLTDLKQMIFKIGQRNNLKMKKEKKINQEMDWAFKQKRNKMMKMKALKTMLLMKQLRKKNKKIVMENQSKNSKARPMAPITKISMETPIEKEVKT